MAVTSEESTSENNGGTNPPDDQTKNLTCQKNFTPLPDYVVSHGAYIPPQSPIYEQAHLQTVQQVCLSYLNY